MQLAEISWCQALGANGISTKLHENVWLREENRYGSQSGSEYRFFLFDAQRVESVHGPRLVWVNHGIGIIIQCRLGVF